MIIVTPFGIRLVVVFRFSLVAWVVSILLLVICVCFGGFIACGVFRWLGCCGLLLFGVRLFNLGLWRI